MGVCLAFSSAVVPLSGRLVEILTDWRSQIRPTEGLNLSGTDKGNSPLQAEYLP